MVYDFVLTVGHQEFYRITEALHVYRLEALVIYYTDLCILGTNLYLFYDHYCCQLLLLINYCQLYPLIQNYSIQKVTFNSKITIAQ